METFPFKEQGFFFLLETIQACFLTVFDRHEHKHLTFIYTNKKWDQQNGNFCGPEWKLGGGF